MLRRSSEHYTYRQRCWCIAFKRHVIEAVCPRHPTHFVVSMKWLRRPSVKKLLTRTIFEEFISVTATLPRTYKRKMKQLELEGLVFASQKLRHSPQIE